MSVDRFIAWQSAPPPLDQLEAVLRDFLGGGWNVEIDGCWLIARSKHDYTEALASQRSPREVEARRSESHIRRARGFQVFHPGVGRTSVITRQADEYTDALADQYARIIARWWDGNIKWPT